MASGGGGWRLHREWRRGKGLHRAEEIVPHHGREPIEDQVPGARPRDAGLRAHLPDRIFRDQVGETRPLVGQDMVDAVGAQAGAEEKIDPAVADHTEVVAQADLPRGPVVPQRVRDHGELCLGGRLLEVMARNDEESVEPQASG